MQILLLLTLTTVVKENLSWYNHRFAIVIDREGILNGRVKQQHVISVSADLPNIDDEGHRVSTNEVRLIQSQSLFSHRQRYYLKR